MTTDEILGRIATALERLEISMSKIANRLDSWDTIYRTHQGAELHSLRMTGSTWTRDATRRRDDRDYRDRGGYQR